MIAALCSLALAGPARAAVTVSFYSHTWGLSPGGELYFPHAFIIVRGTLDATGEPVDQSFGFTAPFPTPALLFHRTHGEIIASAQTYLAVSKAHFSLTVPDERYRTLMDAIDAWRKVKGDPYDLHARNCITFVGEMARALGLNVGDERTQDPARFLDDLRRRNLQLVADAPVTAPGSAAAAGPP
jgi:hypothetical protein